MVDPNPARGMPLQLQRYWLAGKGALKIRWGVPHDFDRCVRNLRKYFPTNPEGLCNILHRKALGVAPGQEHAIVAGMSVPTYFDDLEPITAAATALLAKQPKLGEYLWAGPIVPIGRPTGEPQRTRIFEPGSVRHRTLPLPLNWRERNSQGHDGSMTVGRILGVTYGPDHKGQDNAYAWGDFLDEEIIPESRKARYLMEQGVAGASIDPGGRVVASINPANGFMYTSEYTVGGATLVSIPAFDEMRLYSFQEGADWWDDDDPDMPLNMDEGDCGCGDKVSAKVMIPMAGKKTDEGYAINPDGWHGLPLAPREAIFDNDDAVKRIAAWAGVGPNGADVAKLNQAFLWRDDNMPPTVTTSYRMPLGDIVNNELTLNFHAIYAAAALISGAHGGLPAVSEQDKNHLRNIITDIYRVMAEEFNDPSIRAPWDRPENEGQQFAMADNAKEPYGDVKYADPGYQSDKKKRYPIDTVEHARAAWSYINQAGNASRYSDEQLQQIRSRIQAALKKFGVSTSEEAAMEYAAGNDLLLAPPLTWFQKPDLQGPTGLTVTDEGQVYGHLALWNSCHRDVTNRACTLAPRSNKGYDPFHLGAVLTAEGETIKVGKIIQDTRHANIRLGYAAAAVHYDDTGDEVAVIRCGEDEFGIWFSGALVPEVTPAKIAKLRRSPLSGDWRAVDGHLELTAALAVNVPAFPVYAMEGDETMALVAAGSVFPEMYELPSYDTSEPPTGVEPFSTGSLRQLENDQIAAEERMARFSDIAEDEEIYAQRERIARLQTMEAP